MFAVFEGTNSYTKQKQRRQKWAVNTKNYIQNLYKNSEGAATLVTYEKRAKNCFGGTECRLQTIPPLNEELVVKVPRRFLFSYAFSRQTRSKSIAKNAFFTIWNWAPCNDNGTARLTGAQRQISDELYFEHRSIWSRKFYNFTQELSLFETELQTCCSHFSCLWQKLSSVTLLCRLLLAMAIHAGTLTTEPR